MRRLSLDEIQHQQGKTDWARLKREGDYEGEAEFDVDWSKVEFVEAQPKVMISVRLDADVLNYFKAQGRGYQTRINAVLRSFMEAKSH